MRSWRRGWWWVAAGVAACGGEPTERTCRLFADSDDDGFGAPMVCDEELGVDNRLDCDDTDPLRGGGVEEPYNGRDDDCRPLTPDDDLDGDGLARDVDCDDGDPRLGGPEVPYDTFDNDCDPATRDDDLDGDGYGFAQDCDDTDPATGPVELDADCDGVLRGDDCDDADPSVPSDADADCDGVPADADCDDGDPEAGAVADDGDCDGVPADTDCDDAEPNLGSEADDGDCDGVPWFDDCDDADVSLGSIADDRDCDGLVGDADCDDADPAAPAVADDADCDGVPTESDCDDTDPAEGSSDGDADCDGVPDDVSREGTWALSYADVYADFQAVVDMHGDLDGDGVFDLLVGLPYASRPGTFESGLLAAVPVGGLAAGTVELEQADGQLWGMDDQDRVGFSLATMDVDDDGRADAWLTGIRADSMGVAYLVLADDLTGVSDVPSVAALELVGARASGQLGFVVERAGDVDGDGVGDVMIGEPALVNFAARPRVHLYDGADLLLGASHTELLGRQEDGTGYAVTSLGDLDGDGQSEVAIGSPRRERADRTTAGLVHMVTGASLDGIDRFDLADASVVIEADDDDLHLGTAVASAGDVDGDGITDLFVGQLYAMQGYVFSGALLAAGGTFTSVDDAMVRFDDEGGSYRQGVVSLGDLDGDGFDELALGDGLSDAAYEGAAVLVFGGDLAAAGGVLDRDDASVRFAGPEQTSCVMGTDLDAHDLDGDGGIDLGLSTTSCGDGGPLITVHTDVTLTP